MVGVVCSKLRKILSRKIRIFKEQKGGTVNEIWDALKELDITPNNSCPNNLFSSKGKEQIEAKINENPEKKDLDLEEIFKKIRNEAQQQIAQCDTQLRNDILLWFLLAGIGGACAGRVFSLHYNVLRTICVLVVCATLCFNPPVLKQIKHDYWTRNDWRVVKDEDCCIAEQVFNLLSPSNSSAG